MQVRVDQLVPYGYTDAAIGTFHAFGDRIIREYALELGLPTDVRVLTRPEVVIFLREHLFEFELDEYRPLGDPTRFLGALATLFSRCKDEDVSPAAYLAHADELAARVRRGAGRRGARGGGAPPGRAGPGLRALPGAARGERLHRLRRPGQPRAPARPDLGGGPRGAPVAVPVRPRRRVPGHEPGPVGARLDPRRAASERHGRRRRRPVDLQVPGRGDQQHPRVPRAVSGRPGRSSCAATTARSRRSSMRRTASSGFNDPDRLEVRAGISKRLRPERRDRGGARTVRLEAFATHGEEADWIAAEIGRRIAGGRAAARPRRARPGQRPRGPDPAQPQRRRDPVAVLRHVRAVRPARGPPAARVPARDRRPRSSSVDVYALADRGAVRPRRRGPDGDRQHRAAAPSQRLGGARGARPPARDPAPVAGHTRRGRARFVADLRRFTRARPRAAGGRGPVRVPAGRRDRWPGSRPPTPSRPRRRSGTSPASSTSSAASRRCSPTIGRSSSPATSTR